MTGDREIEEETRNQMMQNLFGDQSEEEEEVEIDSDRDAAAPRASHYQSDEGEGDADIEGEGEVDMEGQGEVEDDSEPEDESGEEVESEAEMRQPDPEQGESETERAQSSEEREISEQRAESEGKDDAESENQEYGHRVVSSQRREVVASESERSEDNHYPDNIDDEVDQERKASSSSEEHDHAVVRDVFGDSEEDESAEYGAQNDIEQDLHRSPSEEEDENYHKDVKPEDMVPDEDAQYESEDENVEQKHKEKEMGPPLDLEIPLHRPPGLPEKMNVIKVSNIMGVEPKPFDPNTYDEEDVFVTDESGTKKRIRLEDNIVRWRSVKNRDGTISHESNARFVRWSDGSLQLLIGNEVLDISVQEAQHDHAHLFLRHEKGILQSQGRLLHKMRFMPSSLSSKSHRLLTALVDSRHKKVYKVKNCITNIDPEKEKEEKERMEGQSIRAMEQLHRKREKFQKRSYNNDNRGQQLSPGFLEEALNEDDDPEEYYSNRRAAARRRFEEDMEMESQAEKRIMNAKRSHPPKDIPRKYIRATHPSKHPVEEYSHSDKEESEYESEEQDVRSPGGIIASDHEDDYNVGIAEEEMGGAHAASRDNEEEEPKRRNKEALRSSQKRKEIESDGESPPRKTMTHRRLAVFDSDED